MSQPIRAEPLGFAHDLPTTPDVSANAEPLPRQFCPTCGAPWQTHWHDCLACRGRSARRAAAQQAIAAEQPSFITFALALYFTLLATSAIGIVAGVGGAGDRLIIDLTIAHSVIILCWSICFRRAVVPALLKPFPIGWIPAAVGAGLLTFLLATGLIAAMHRFLGVAQLRMSDGYLHAGHGWGFVVLMIAVQPAILEELGFRGVILPALQPALAVREAVIVSALLFMTAHWSVVSFPHLFVMGLVLGFLRARTGSIVPGSILHFTHNLLCIWAEHHWG